MSFDDWKTTEPVDWRDQRDYCPECDHIWAKCKCEPDVSEEPISDARYRDEWRHEAAEAQRVK